MLLKRARLQGGRAKDIVTLDTSEILERRLSNALNLEYFLPASPFSRVFWASGFSAERISRLSRFAHICIISW